MDTGHELRLVLTVITTLWKHYRAHVKIELAVLCQNVLIKMLRSGSCEAAMSLTVMSELASWSSPASDLAELVLNFDNYQPVQDCKVFESLVSYVVTVAQEGLPLAAPDELRRIRLSCPHVELVVVMVVRVV